MKISGRVLYANEIRVSYDAEVFLLTFGFTSPLGESIHIHIILTPSGTRMLHDFLGKALQEYVEKYGDIKVGEWHEPNEQGGNVFSV